MGKPAKARQGEKHHRRTQGCRTNTTRRSNNHTQQQQPSKLVGARALRRHLQQGNDDQRPPLPPASTEPMQGLYPEQSTNTGDDKRSPPTTAIASHTMRRLLTTKHPHSPQVLNAAGRDANHRTCRAPCRQGQSSTTRGLGPPWVQAATLQQAQTRPTRTILRLPEGDEFLGA